MAFWHQNHRTQWTGIGVTRGLILHAMDRVDLLQPLLLAKFRDTFDTLSSPPPPRPISAAGVAMDPAKVDTVQSWPTP